MTRGDSAKRRFIREVRARTVCERCGGQPVDWHNPEHAEEPHRRLGRWRMAGTTIADIEAEIAACRALCRSCHMAEDGRDRFHETSPRHDQTPPGPCAKCGRVVARLLARGLCRTCYHRLWYRATHGISAELYDFPSRDDVA